MDAFKILTLQMKNFAIEIKWGIRYIFAYLAWIIMEKSIGIYTTKIDDLHSFVSTVLPFRLSYLYFGIIDKKKHFFNDNMEWKQGCVSRYFSFNRNRCVDAFVSSSFS